MKPEAIISRELGKFATRLKTADGRLFTGLRRSRFTLVILLSTIAIFQLHSLPGSLSIGTLDAALILQPRTRPQKVRLVVIDDKDYATWFQGESPLDPKPLGQIITAIWKGQPSLIVVDLDTGHQKFRNLAVPPQARIVWAVDFETTREGRITMQAPLGGASMPSIWSSAVAAFPNDQRGVIRGYRRQFAGENGMPQPSVAWDVAQRLRGADPQARVQASQNERLLDFRCEFPVQKTSSADPLSLSNILEHADEEGWPRGLLHDKVVVLGGAYRAARDDYATPVGVLYGSQIIAQAVEAEITNTSIPPASRWAVGFIELLAGLLLILIHHKLGLRSAFWLSLILIPVISIAASLILFHRLAGWIAVIPVLAAVLVAELYAKAADLLIVLKTWGVIAEQESASKSESAGQPQD